MWGSTLNDVTLRAQQNAVNQTEISFATILGQNISMKGIKDAFSPMGKDHNTRLINYWQRSLRELLAPYSYERRAFEKWFKKHPDQQPDLN
jgi:hypothetical protein